MGSITERKRRDGTPTFTARVRVMRDGATHSEAETFERRKAAEAWIKRREVELAAPGGLRKAKSGDPTLADVIDKYIETTTKEIGRTKAQVLRSIKGYDLAGKRCSEITSADIVAFAQEIGANVKPQTVGNYLSHLGAVFAIARPAWGIPLDEQAMKDAFTVSKRLGVTTKSQHRSRRPTLDELDRLMTHFGEVRAKRPSTMPMQRIMALAIFSTRRQEEITRIAWDDLEEDGSRVLVRDMKNPGQKIGNDVWCELPPEALAIIQALPRLKPQIMPYGGDAISAAFTRACQFLGIKDLHFHDLRHDGVSRLFEMGRNVPQVAAVSGHRSWASLQRYTHIRQAGDKYAGWNWLPIVTAPEVVTETFKRRILARPRPYARHSAG